MCYLESLKSLRLTRQQCIDEHRKLLEDNLLQKIMDTPGHVTTGNAAVVNLDVNSIVFYLCGFIAHKKRMFTECAKCLEMLDDPENRPAEAALVSIKTMGKLKYPNKALYHLINDNVEHIFSGITDNDLASKSFTEFLVAKIERLECSGLGCCSEHSEKLTVKIVMYYITIRLFFIAIHHNKENLSSGKKSHDKRKESKLV